MQIRPTTKQFQFDLGVSIRQMIKTGSAFSFSPVLILYLAAFLNFLHLSLDVVILHFLSFFLTVTLYLNLLQSSANPKLKANIAQYLEYRTPD